MLLILRSNSQRTCCLDHVTLMSCASDVLQQHRSTLLLSACKHTVDMLMTYAAGVMQGE